MVAFLETSPSAGVLLDLSGLDVSIAAGIVVGDFDQDGMTDILVDAGYGNIVILWGEMLAALNRGARCGPLRAGLP